MFWYDPKDTTLSETDFISNITSHSFYLPRYNLVIRKKVLLTFLNKIFGNS